MSDGVSIDIGGLLPYLEEKVLGLLGKDARHLSARQTLERNLRISAKDATAVQIVGMDRPISIFDIYQPTRLVRRRDNRFADFNDLVERASDAIIFGRPGGGKTMLARYLFASLSKDKNLVPVLFTLRRSEAVEDLKTLVTAVSDATLKLGKARLILLVDGYDEVSTTTRQQVADILRNFWSLNIGNFFLTCRSYYDTAAVSAPHWDIAPFSVHDAEGFIKAFAKAYQSDLDASVVIRDLHDKGFADFLQHPLLLALVCILKSGPMPTLPRSSIGLIRRAVDTLTFRWDEAKQLARESRYDLDGEDRKRCLMRVAFNMHRLIEKEDVVIRATQEQLRLLQRPDVSVERLLEELAQWYGLLVPSEDNHWSFVHRTIHDYLAALFWIETAGFDPQTVTEWNSRAAYAACMTGDATRAMLKMLSSTKDTGPFVECLSNNAAFDVEKVADAVVDFFHRNPEAATVKRDSEVEVTTTKGFFALASDDFLRALSEASAPGKLMSNEALLWCAIAELHNRGVVVSPKLRESVIARFGESTPVSVSMNDILTRGSVLELVSDRRSG